MHRARSAHLSDALSILGWWTESRKQEKATESVADGQSAVIPGPLLSCSCTALNVSWTASVASYLSSRAFWLTDRAGTSSGDPAALVPPSASAHPRSFEPSAVLAVYLALHFCPRSLSSSWRISGRDCRVGWTVWHWQRELTCSHM